MFFINLKIMVTGGGGFIGSHLCKSLEENGHDVLSVDIRFQESVFNGKRKMCDISSDQLDTNGFPIVIHLAAISRVQDADDKPERCIDVNAKGTLRVALACKKSNSRLIFASSREVYGKAKSLPVFESNERNPISLYGITKSLGEDIVRAYVDNHVILRFSNVYGSLRDIPARVIPKFVSNAISGMPIRIYNPDQVIDFLFIDDAVKAIILTVGKLSGNVMQRTYNICYGSGTPLFDLARLVIRLTHSKSEIVVDNIKSNSVPVFVGSNALAREELGFNPEYGLKEGLTRYLEQIV